MPGGEEEEEEREKGGGGEERRWLTDEREMVSRGELGEGKERIRIKNGRERHKLVMTMNSIM